MLVPSCKSFSSCKHLHAAVWVQMMGVAGNPVDEEITVRLVVNVHDEDVLGAMLTVWTIFRPLRTVWTLIDGKADISSWASKVTVEL